MTNMKKKIGKTKVGKFPQKKVYAKFYKIQKYILSIKITNTYNNHSL